MLFFSRLKWNKGSRMLNNALISALGHLLFVGQTSLITSVPSYLSMPVAFLFNTSSLPTGNQFWFSDLIWGTITGALSMREISNWVQWNWLFRGGANKENGWPLNGRHYQWWWLLVAVGISVAPSTKTFLSSMSVNDCHLGPFINAITCVVLLEPDICTE